MQKQQIVNVFGETEVEAICCNYTFRHGLSDHNNREKVVVQRWGKKYF
jgi:hypothetical protein